MPFNSKALVASNPLIKESLSLCLSDTWKKNRPTAPVYQTLDLELSLSGLEDEDRGGEKKGTRYVYVFCKVAPNLFDNVVL